MNGVEDATSELQDVDDGVRSCSCEAGSLFAAGAGLLLQDPPSLSHPMTSGRVKILPKISLQQHCDLTLYYTGLDMSTARMQRCPPLNLWFSAARVSFPRDHSAVALRYMDMGGLRQRRSACTETGWGLRVQRTQGWWQRSSPFWVELSWAATFCFSPPSLMLVGGGTAACLSPWAEEKNKTTCTNSEEGLKDETKQSPSLQLWPLTGRQADIFLQSYV